VTIERVLVAVVVVTLSALASGHALVFKRDPRSAIAWVVFSRCSSLSTHTVGAPPRRRPPSRSCLVVRPFVSRPASSSAQYTSGRR